MSAKAKTNRLTNDQRFAECLRILANGVALAPGERAIVDKHIAATEKQPEATETE